ncbi:hypothetical protein ALP18_200209 [Pseudomonas amygdali pv. myricae]|nr:hypothetical protein ALP18_200209 [Pseudomonas amygdali pv. myricae]
MRLPLDAERLHDVLENATFGHGAVVQVDHLGTALERKGRVSLRYHGVEQKAQRRFRVFTVNAVVFLVSHTAAVIYHAEQHQRRFTLAQVNPFRLFDVLEVGRRQVELPAVIAVLSLKPNGRRLPQ